MNNEEEFSTLMSNVMKIQCRMKDEDFSDRVERLTYKAGHRDARHDAVDLIAEFASRFRAQGGNTSDNITQAAANKAAEEGGLPPCPDLPRETAWFDNDRMHFEFGEPEFRVNYYVLGQMLDYARAYARAAIEADRASRQVDNKAEVDLSSIKRYYMGASDMKQNEAGEWLKLKDVEALFATPPATTGASTTRDQALEEAARICDGVNNHDNPMTAGDCADSIRALKGSVGASTVLTDERTAALTEARNAVSEMRNHLETFGQYGEETARAALDGAVDTIDELIGEVAAQAGQVAVPDDLTACANCLRPKCEHNGKLCPRPFTTHWHAWDYKNQAQPTYPEYAAPSPAKESK